MRRAATYVAVLAIGLLAWWALTATQAVAPIILPHWTLWSRRYG